MVRIVRDVKHANESNWPGFESIQNTRGRNKLIGDRILRIDTAA